MSRYLAITSAALMFALTTQFAAGDILYSTTFNDLAGWSTFGTTAAASTDTETDGRSVYLNTSTSGTTAILQRPLSSALEFGPQTSLTAVLRRNAPANTYTFFQLFRNTTDTHTAGDVQAVTVFLNASNVAQMNVSHYDTTAGTSTTVSSFFSTAALPFNNLASDYTTLTLSLPQNGQFTLTDSALGSPIFSLNLGTQFGQLMFLRNDIFSNGESQSAWLVDSITLSVPEPASMSIVVGLITLMVSRRRH
jgi:hypothetical protein